MVFDSKSKTDMHAYQKWDFWSEFDKNSHLTYRLYLKLFKEAIQLGKRHREKVLREEAEAEEHDQK